MTNVQCPMSNVQRMTNVQCPTDGLRARSAPGASRAVSESRRSNGSSLVIGNWSFFGHWSLVIGHFSSVILHSVAPLALSVLVAGCAGYHLGSTNGVPAGERSVQVNPFLNKTIEPRLSDALAISLRKNLQKDGTYRLNTHNEGDIILSGSIVNYDRHELSFQPTDVVTPRQYRVVITAQVTARERLSGKIVLNRTVSGQSSLFVGNDLPSAERQLLPLVADDLARNITAFLVDGEW
jgi:hypothetical protein